MNKKTKVLIVEDEAIIAKLMCRNLRLLGYNVCAMVTTGRDAIAQTEKERPDVVVMDIHLPGEIDGIDAALTIRERYATPIIFVTGYANNEVRERASKVPPIAFLTKPVSTQKLVEAIDRAAAKDTGDDV